MPGVVREYAHPFEHLFSTNAFSFILRCLILKELPDFFSISFRIYGFMWRSLIHLDLSAVESDNMYQFALFYT